MKVPLNSRYTYFSRFLKLSPGTPNATTGKG